MSRAAVAMSDAEVLAFLEQERLRLPESRYRQLHLNEWVASEDRLTELGVLGRAWKHLPTDGNRLSLVDLPAGPRELYRATGCIGRFFTDDDSGHRRRISPASATPRFSALPPRHAP